MGLNYWGWDGSQADAARWLKPDANDKNVTPEQMVEFVNRELGGLKAVSRHAGNIALLKRLIVAGYPVVVETGFAPDGYDWMGHYRLVIGYSDAEGSFYVYDSFLGDGGGQGRVMRYDELDKLWQEFNRVYVVVYPEAQETHVAGVLGDDWDPELNAQHALRTAQIEAQMDRGNPFAWFNLGTSFVLNGQFEEASRAYDEARNLGLPWRMLWYQFGPFEAYLNTNRLDDVLALALANDNNTKEVEETYYYWGLALAQRGQYAEAGQKFRQATTINRNFDPAYQAIQALPQ
ncbi:MAG: C39 family peptidase [Anaerolineae bacterium]|nr:C39 family peptidase [Anaerolineae bacterium]